MTSCCPLPGQTRNGNPDFRGPPRYRILLSNGRFPVSIDLARQLYCAGHYVYVVDPMEYHVCKFSIAVRKSRQVPAPHVDAEGYIQAVHKAVAQWNIDLVIPVHEEIFFLAECGDDLILERLLAPPFDVLIRLHNKWEFTKMMQHLSIDVPESHLCRNLAEVGSLDRSREWALKPVFGRAASNIHHLKPHESLPDDVDVDDDNHYVAQEWIKGKRHCSYSIIRHGCIVAHGVYPVLETIDGSSSVYFRQQEHPHIREYVSRVAAALPNVTAQIAFDFIEDGERLVAIECNPRATSGIHLWSDSPLLARAMTDPHLDEDLGKDGYITPPRNLLGGNARRQVTPGMLMWDHSQATWREYFKHMKRLMGSRDVLWKTTDMLPSLMQPFMLTSYYKICRERKLNLPTVFQWDLVWEPDYEKMQRVRRLIDEADWRDENESGQSERNGAG